MLYYIARAERGLSIVACCSTLGLRKLSVYHFVYFIPIAAEPVRPKRAYELRSD